MPKMDPNRLARQAGRRLARELGEERLPEHVELALARGAQSTPTYSLELAIALASFVVSTAGVAWTIWSDLRKRGEDARQGARDRLVVLILQREPAPPGLPPDTARKVVDAVADELVRDDES